MSTFPAFRSALYPRDTVPPKWFIRTVTLTIDEGDEASIEIWCTNYTVGAQLHLWWYRLVGTAHWSRSWHTALQEAALAAGCTYAPDSGSAVLGSLSGRLIIGPTYDGRRLVVRNRARKNRKNDVTPNPDGSPGSRVVAMSVDDPTTTGSFAFTVDYQIFIRDTSRTPLGQPAIRIKALDLDGVSPAKANYFEGETFLIEISTEFITPGTRVRTFIANVGQTRFQPSYRSAMISHLKTRTDVEYTVSDYPLDPGEIFYQGATITYLDTYLDSNPIRVPVTVKSDNIEQPNQQADFIILVEAEGDLSEFTTVADQGTWVNTKTYRRGDTVVWLDDGGNYVYTNSGAAAGKLPSDEAYWRPYLKTLLLGGAVSRSIRDQPKRYWEISARSDGATITYALHVPSGDAVNSSVVMTTGGTKPPGYDEALAAALAANPDRVTYEGGRYYARAALPTTAELNWTVPHPVGVSGKHTLRLSDVAGDTPAWIVIEDAVVFLEKPTMPNDPTFITGTNIDGGEFGRTKPVGYDNYGLNYRYPHRMERADPAQRHIVMDYHWSKGSRLFRFPFRWGRIMAEPFGPLTGNDPPVSATDRADMWRMDECIDYWTNVLGGWCLLDCHDFGTGPLGGDVRYDYNLDARGVPIAALSDLWVKLANRYLDNEKVWLGIMNEPNGYIHGPARNRDNMQAVTNAVRARTDSRAKIVIAGCDYSSAGRWVTNGNAEALESYYDPLDNCAMEAHCYFDADSSGTKPACAAGTRNRLNDVTAWAKRTGNKMLLGEFGAGDPAVSGQETCGVEMPGALAIIRDNKDAWLGWTAYFGGDMWGATFPFTIDPAYPKDFTMPTYDNGQMKMLLPFFETIL